MLTTTLAIDLSRWVVWGVPEVVCQEREAGMGDPEPGGVSSKGDNKWSKVTEAMTVPFDACT